MKISDIRTINRLIENTPLPPMVRVRQHFGGETLADPQGEIRRQLRRPELKAAVRPGMHIAVTAGSRGIDQMHLLLREVIAFLKEQGAKPFLVPAMGSHGGATAEGQRALLAGYGVTEESMGVPIRATMDVVQIATLPDGRGVYIDRYAQEADGIVVVNRVKPHTAFRGRHESGLFKMMAIGLGKQYGAAVLHALEPPAMADNVTDFGGAILANAKILFGLATVENASERLCRVESFTPEEMEEGDARLLVLAKELMPRIRFPNLDVLVIDRIGKNISGSGMDSNVTRRFIPSTGLHDPTAPARIAILDLTEETNGAANGVGMADVTTRRLFEKMDLSKTYPNAITCRGPEVARLPMLFENQRLTIQAAAAMVCGADWDRLRMVRIQDTLHVEELWISQALLAEAEADPQVEILGEVAPMAFDENGDLF